MHNYLYIYIYVYIQSFCIKKSSLAHANGCHIYTLSPSTASQISVFCLHQFYTE
jgi:hypothetical protein